MANEKIMAVGIKKLYYGPVITDSTFDPTKLKTLLSGETLTEVINVHQDTWSYEEAEASVTEYKNQLSKNTYRQTQEQGTVQVSFTIGQYDFQTKADLQGGMATATGWQRARGYQEIYKCVIAETEDDVWIVFPKAAIVGRGADTDGAIGLAVAATPMEPETKELNPEYWWADSVVNPSI